MRGTRKTNFSAIILGAAETVILLLLLVVTLLLLGGKAWAYTVTPNSVTFNWTAPGDNGQFGTAAYYDIRYTTSPLNESNWSSAAQAVEEPLPSSSGETESFTVDNLDPAVTYYFALKSYDQAGNDSPMSNVLQATTSLTLDTDADVTIVAPPDGAVERSTRPVLSVLNIDTQSTNQYFFEIAEDSNFVAMADASLAVTQETGATTTWKVEERLAEGATYYWRAIANGSFYSEIFDFTVQPITHVYPNPYRPGESPEAVFTDVPVGRNLYLMTVSGREVRLWSNTTGEDILWDGTNSSGNPVASDTYLWFIAGTDIQGKLVVIR